MLGHVRLESVLLEDNLWSHLSLIMLLVHHIIVLLQLVNHLLRTSEAIAPKLLSLIDLRNKIAQVNSRLLG